MKIDLTKERKRIQRELMKGITLRTKVIKDKSVYTRKSKHKKILE